MTRLYTRAIPAWLDNSYTTLIAEIGGLIVAVLGLRALLQWDVPLRHAIPTVAAILLLTIAVPSVWSAMRGLDGTRDGLVLAPGINEREKCFVDARQNWAVNFMRWVSARIPKDASFAFSGRADPVCVQLVLFPRVWAPSNEKAQYRVYAGVVPADVRARIQAERQLPPASRTIQSYGRDLLVVRDP